LKGDANGKEAQIQRKMEFERPQYSKEALPDDADVKSGQKGWSQNGRRKKESVEDETQKIEGLSQAHRQGVVGQRPKH
jgi:Asp-tRNA(Asn)/Glu-tRNA(Gln) amidotransferase B subunit